MKQKRKEEKRLHKAEVHAAISVAGVAAALAAIAAEDTEANKQKSLKDSAVASAAALLAAQCAQVAETVGAKREQLSSAINEAVTVTDASNIITLTAAAATCNLNSPIPIIHTQTHSLKYHNYFLQLLIDDLRSNNLLANFCFQILAYEP